MPIVFHETSIPGLFLISPHEANDERGYLKKYFDKDVFIQKGLASEFCESAEIMSCKGTLRGLHYQKNPSQARLIQIISGKIFNVSLDLDPVSPTFGKYECCRLSCGTAIYVPENFANGFLAMEDNTLIVCHFSKKFYAEGSSGILFNDAELNIPWPLDAISTLIISEKDKMFKTFNQYKQELA